MIPLANRKVHVGYEDKFCLTFDKEVSRSGYIFREPMNITDWTFELFFHRGVEMNCQNTIFGVKGDVLDGLSGKVFFIIPAHETCRKPGTYWYTLQITRPNGKITRTESAKYVIAESLNPYYSIYKK